MDPIVTVLTALAAGLLVAAVTAPVGVSGAVFLLPVQLDVLRVPSPAVTPTNLLFNVIATPGALWRHHRAGRLHGPLVGMLLAGTVPGVLIGCVLRVFAAPGDTVFRLLAGCLLAPLGGWLILRPRPRDAERRRPPRRRTITALGIVVGVVGGIYGVGGGSLLGPILVGYGLPIALVAPAALAATFATSVAGVLGYALLALVTTGPVAPDWTIGVACGFGGLIGGYLGTWIAPHVPETGLRALLGLLALGLGATYVVQALH